RGAAGAVGRSSVAAAHAAMFAHIRHPVIELLLLIRIEHGANVGHLLRHHRPKGRAASAVATAAVRPHRVRLQFVLVAYERDSRALILREIEPAQHAVALMAAAHPAATSASSVVL